MLRVIARGTTPWLQPGGSSRPLRFQGSDSTERLNPLLAQDQCLLSSQGGQERQRCFNPKLAKVLVSVDLDGTLSTDWAGAAGFAKGGSHRLLHLNTGRAVDDLAPLSKRFKEIPLYAISTSNGESLFINRQGLPAHCWIEEIAQADRKGQSLQEPEWTAEQRQASGWCHWRAKEIVQSFVGRRLAEPGYGALECIPSSRQVISEILAALKAADIRSQVTVEDGRLYKFSPQGYAKDSPVLFLARRCPQLRGVVVAGDAANDYPLMRLEAVPNALDHWVPVRRLFMSPHPAQWFAIQAQVPKASQIHWVQSLETPLFAEIQRQADELEREADRSGLEAGPSQPALMSIPPMTVDARRWLRSPEEAKDRLPAPKRHFRRFSL